MIGRRQALAGAVAALGAGLGAGPARAAAGPRAQSAEAFIAGLEECRLIDVVGPDGRGPPDRARALAAFAAAALQALLDEGAPEIPPAAPADRWGRRLLRPRRARSGATFQEHLVAIGAVRVRPESADGAAIRALLAIEAEARAGGEGLWGDPAYAPFPADRADGAVGAFNLVEGVVVSARTVRARTYFNFGADWREDFTATATARIARRLNAKGLDPEGLAGVRVRVRGFVARINGPSIELVRPEALERIAVGAGAGAPG